MSGAGELLLDARRVAKQFGGVQALRDVSLSIRAGEIYGLIGPNGAGKTTFFNVLTGLYAPDGGELVFAGRTLQAGAPHRAAAQGIARTFQNIRLFANMTALENVMVGRHVRTRAGVLGAVLHDRRTRAEEAAIRRRAEELLHYVHIADRADDLAKHLSYGDQRRLEIARALAADPCLLLLDEPAAGLRLGEKQALGDLLRKLRSEGMAILLVEHDMDFVMELVDRIVVMDFGQKIAEGLPEEIQNNRAVLEAYLGVADEEEGAAVEEGAGNAIAAGAHHGQ